MSYRYVLSGDYTEQPSLYKLYFGNKYYIWKGKSLKQSVDVICKDISRYHANGIPDDHLLKKVIDQIKRYRCLFCRVEVLLQTDNVTDLLNQENLTLAKGKEDPECLNVKFEGHISKWMMEQIQHEQLKENIPAQNKAISATFIKPNVSIPQLSGKTKPNKELSAPGGKPSLMDALSKLKNK